MAINYIKRYNELLELNHLNERDRKISLKAIFDRDIADNQNFSFNSKIIRPLKKEDKIDVESLFKHLTYKTEDETDNKGKVIQTRDFFDFERSKRLHWILPHIESKIPDVINVFSAINRIRGKDIIRTYIHNVKENYIIILEPQRSGQDYYFITAYYLEKKYGGLNMIKNKYKNKLDEVL
ncbi:hypothetical protein [Flavobacterium ajazii]|uniref:hypothetical protein n=1 Tax=Flavobacterium ajazii TaxID=2692318 RepID=UPI0013D28D32|nr:hypothetical protein [Flavobacterium ajazii]